MRETYLIFSRKDWSAFLIHVDLVEEDHLIPVQVGEEAGVKLGWDAFWVFF